MKTLPKNVSFLTRKDEQELWKQYHDITNEYNKTTLAMGVSDSLDSDLRENPEFMELRVKAMYTLPQKKKELYEKLRNVVIVEEMEEYKNFDGKTVILGSTVTLDIDGETEIYTILGTSDGDIEKGILSARAKLAEKILYHKVGDIVELNDLKIKILSVEKVVL